MHYEEMNSTNQNYIHSELFMTNGPIELNK